MSRNYNKKDVDKCIKYIKDNIDIREKTNCKIDVDTKSCYYKINIIYSNKKDEKTNLFSEYILEKEENYLMHYLSNDSNNLINKKSCKDDIIEEIYGPEDIIKIFYDKDKWITIPNFNNEILSNSFKNKEDIYEILNKNYYYTYIIKNGKIKILNKGKINDKEGQIYNENIIDILFSDKKYIIKVKNEIKNNGTCINKSDCINPRCHFIHPDGHNVYDSYKKYIIEKRMKNPYFKTINCVNKDNCIENNYNKCKYKHENDPI